MNIRIPLIAVILSSLTPIASMANLNITNGHPVPVGQYPWYAAISPQSAASTSVGCGGALINQKWIVTAKHCLVDYGPWSPGKVVFGIYDKNHPYKIESRKISKIVLNKNYDIGLAELDNSVTDIKPIKIEDSLPRLGGSMIIMGYGISHRCGSDLKSWCPSNVLMEATTPIQENSVCLQSKWGIVNFHPKYNICVGTLSGSRINAGLGDSGSPGVQYLNGKYMLLGVVSRGGTKVDYDVPAPAAYISVPSFKEWINGIVTD